MLEIDWQKMVLDLSAGVSFREEGHAYTHERLGKLASVTTVMSSVLPDHNGVKNRWTERHRRMGTVVHACTALDDQGRLDESSVAEPVRARLSAWRAFRREYARRFVPHLIEQTMWSVNGTAGTADRIGLWDGRLCVLDVKSTVMQWYARLQTAGYSALVFERTGLLVEVRVAVGVADDGLFDLHVWDDPRARVSDAAAWSAAVTLYKFQQQHYLLPREEVL